MSYIENPKTGRRIRVDGPTYQKLLRDGEIKSIPSPRSKSTRKSTTKRSIKRSATKRPTRKPIRKSSNSRSRSPAKKAPRKLARRSPTRSPNKKTRKTPIKGRQQNRSRSSSLSPSKINHNDVWYKSESILNPRQKKWCSCVVQVAKRNSEKCNRSFKGKGNKRLTGKTVDGKKCYNPYAVCSKTVGTSSGRRSCGNEFRFDDLPDDELRAYSELLHVDVPKPYNRTKMLANMKRYKSQE